MIPRHRAVIPEQDNPSCAHCGHAKKWQGLVVVGKDDEKPRTGDVLICEECCRINVLVVDGAVHSFRAPDDHEMNTFRRDALLRKKINMAILNAQAERFVRLGGLRP